MLVLVLVLVSVSVAAPFSRFYLFFVGFGFLVFFFLRGVRACAKKLLFFRNCLRVVQKSVFVFV